MLISKKYRIGQSYIALWMLCTLVSTPLLTATTYAQELENVDASVEAKSEDNIQSTVDSIEDTKSVSSSASSSMITDTLPNSQIGVEIPHRASSSTSGATLYEDIQTVVSTATSTASSTIILVDTSSSSPDMPIFLETIGTSTLDIAGTSTKESIDVTSDGERPVGTTTISTGVSVATANIINLLNTTSINSTGSIILGNIINGQSGDIDLRTNTLSTTSCTLLGCGGGDTLATIVTADAVLDTTVSLIATSGSNEITTADTSIITTGEVYAGLNLVNVVNTVLIDSQYLLASLNSFGNVDGDIIFPALNTFFTNVTTNTTPELFFEDIHTNAKATINNALIVEANAGKNNITSSSSILQTGTSNSSLSTYNNVNSSFVGGNSLLLLLRVTGVWLGTLVGTPESLQVVSDGNMHLLQLEEDGNSQSRMSVGTLESTSTVLLSNTVDVRADSGNNTIEDSSIAEITTGNAYALATVINIANTHIIGRNWILAIINIFGNFDGNIVFGRPDLWVGEQVSGESTITNDTNLLYTITVINKGDNVSSNVTVTSSYDNKHLDSIDSHAIFSDDRKGNVTFALGDLLPKESREISFRARVKETVPGTRITNTVVVSGEEKDNNTADNTDSTTISTTISHASGGDGYQYTPQRMLLIRTIPQSIPTPEVDTLHYVTITRVSTSTTISKEGEEVEQVIRVRNNTTTEIPSVTFNDFLLDEGGKKVKTESWDIGSLLAGEEVTLTYSLSFATGAPEGVYTLSSETLGVRNQSVFFSNNGIVTNTPNIKKLVSTSTPLTLILEEQAQAPLKVALSEKEIPWVFSIQKMFFETAYGAGENDIRETQASRSLPTSLQYVFLFLLFSLVRMFHRYQEKNTLR